LAFALVTCHAEANSAASLLTGFGYARTASGDFSVGGRRYATFFADCRSGTTEDWVGGLADRVGDAPPPLDRAAFDAAVREARSPLLATCGELSTPEAIRDALRAAAASLADDPREEHLFRAVDRTYLRPAGTQERTAELLGLPFSTYRRHLPRGIARITELLWHTAASA
jgi:hypothetical protein